MSSKDVNVRAKVAVVDTGGADYPVVCPYDPPVEYPEYPFPGHVSEMPNAAYAGVRQLFYLLGFDRERWGAKDWNPLGHLIEPGMMVVLKPNFVASRHPAGKDPYSIITHPGVLRAIADYCWIALKGQGRIVIADAPQYDCDFRQLLGQTKLDQMVNFYRDFRGPEVELYDLREYWSRWKHFPSLLEPLPGDPKGTLTMNLGRHSALYGRPYPEKLYGAAYHRGETIDHHRGETHEYALARTVMDADVVITVPKLKVHKKVGVTLNIKGLVGVCTNKNYLVHYSLTPPSEGGDQYPDDLFTPMEEALIKAERWMYDHFLAPRQRLLEYLHRSIYWLHNHITRRLGIKVSESKRQLDAGNWYGNDSAWRMAVDLCKAFYFADRQGRLQNTPQRRMFSVVDGVVGGENNGPLAPDPVPAQVLLAGDNLLAVDLVATRLMGFDPLKLPMYRKLLSDPDLDFGIHKSGDIQVICANLAWADCLADPTSPFLNFKPHPGWVGHIEAAQDKTLALAI